MNNIWFTSDTHYHHKNIVRGCTNWEGSLQRCRDFDTLEQHNQTLVDNINNVVKENDILYHCGDWSFGGFDNIWNFRKQLNCKNIHLIFGNHDHHIENNRGGCQGYFTSVQYYKEIFVDKNKIILFHYAMRVWNQSHHNSWLLYGHSHGTIDNNYGKSMDVGVDTHPEFRPYHYDEIKQIMNNRESVLIDHHSEKTN